MLGIGAFFTALLGRLAGLATWTGALMVAAFAALWLLATDAGVWVFDQALGLVVLVLSGIDWPEVVFDAAAYVQALPPDILNVLGLIGVAEALGIIFAAVMIRIALQLVPFTRLGS